MQKINSESDFLVAFDNFYPSLFNLAHKMLYDRQAAEDVTQEVFLKLWQAKGSIRITTDLGAYLKRAVVNQSLNHLKKGKRMVRLNTDLAPPVNAVEEIVEFNDLERRINEAVLTLSPKRRLIFSLSRFDGMSNQEIADHFGITKKTVENQLGTALSELRSKLKPYLPVIILALIAALVIGFLSFF
ncbi:MAG: RNA polymerase sigma-70 factor [Bacteroidota bacterium]